DVGPVAATEDAHTQLRAPGAHQARDADHLAGADVQVRTVDDHAVRVGGVVHPPVLDPEDLLADVDGPVGVAVRQVAAHHALDDAVLADVTTSQVEGFDGAPVADDRDLVGDLLDLVEFVADDDRRDPLT